MKKSNLKFNVMPKSVVLTLVLALLATTVSFGQKTIEQNIGVDSAAHIVFNTNDEVKVEEWNMPYMRVYSIVFIDGDSLRLEVKNEIVDLDVFQLTTGKNEKGETLLEADGQRKNIRVNRKAIDWSIQYLIFVPKSVTFETRNEIQGFAEKH